MKTYHPWRGGNPNPDRKTHERIQRFAELFYCLAIGAVIALAAIYAAFNW